LEIIQDKFPITIKVVVEDEHELILLQELVKSTKKEIDNKRTVSEPETIEYETEPKEEDDVDDSNINIENQLLGYLDKNDDGTITEISEEIFQENVLAGSRRYLMVWRIADKLGKAGVLVKSKVPERGTVWKKK